MIKNAHSFGQLGPKPILDQELATEQALKHFEKRKRETASKTEKAVTWVSYFTMLYATIIALSPQTALAAIKTVAQVMG